MLNNWQFPEWTREIVAAPHVAITVLSQEDSAPTNHQVSSQDAPPPWMKNTISLVLEEEIRYQHITCRPHGQLGMLLRFMPTKFSMKFPVSASNSWLSLAKNSPVKLVPR
jgi:hypothetical protein